MSERNPKKERTFAQKVIRKAGALVTAGVIGLAANWGYATLFGQTDEAPLEFPYCGPSSLSTFERTGEHSFKALGMTGAKSCTDIFNRSTNKSQGYLRSDETFYMCIKPDLDRDRAEINAGNQHRTVGQGYIIMSDHAKQLAAEFNVQNCGPNFIPYA